MGLRRGSAELSESIASRDSGGSLKEAALRPYGPTTCVAQDIERVAEPHQSEPVRAQ